MVSVFIWLATILLLAIGLVGTVIPGLPGMGFIFLGVLLFAAAGDFTMVSPFTVVMFGVVSLLAVIADYIGSAWGARMGGGNRYALIGAGSGAILGAIISGPIGIIVGGFIGGLIGALIEGKSNDQAMKVALYSMIGAVGASVMQFLLALILIIAFVIAVFI